VGRTLYRRTEMEHPDWWKHNELRIWFAIPKNEEESQDSIAYLRGLCEELLLGKVDFRIEVHAKKRVPIPVAEASCEPPE
jgi:hypothetical protein